MGIKSLLTVDELYQKMKEQADALNRKCSCAPAAQSHLRSWTEEDDFVLMAGEQSDYALISVLCRSLASIKKRRALLLSQAETG